MKNPEFVYKIIDRATGEAVPCYTPGRGDVYEFGSVASARNSNCHDVFTDYEKYRIAKYRVSYDLVEEDCHGHTLPRREPTLLEETFAKIRYRWECEAYGIPVNENAKCEKVIVRE